MSDPDAQNRRNERRRELACRLVETVADDVARGVPADRSLARCFRENRGFGARDRRFYSESVFSYFRWLGWTQLAAPDRLDLRCALAVLLDDAGHRDAVTVWRSVLSDHRPDLVPVPSDVAGKADWMQTLFPAATCTVGSLAPDWLSAVVPPSRFERFVTGCQFRPPSWIRIAPHDEDSFIHLLSEGGIEGRRHRGVAGAIALTPPVDLHRLERAWGRPIQVQDLASQMVVKACDARSGERWWDACSGSGGKTLGLAETADHVVATDTRASILRNLEQRARDHRVDNRITCRVMDAAQEAAGGDPFDGVLVDAPCSGLGTWPRNPDARWRTSADDVAARAGLQAAILRRAASRVRPGGVLVYSVCTVTDREGPDIIRDFLRVEPGFRPEPFPRPDGGSAADGCLLVMPDDGPCDGMFIARLRRAE